MMMITRQEWRIVIVYLNIRMTQGNGDTQRSEIPEIPSLSCHSLCLNIPLKVVPGPGSHLASSEHKPEILASVQAARAGGWTCCLKYPNLYVFDEAIGQARCPVLSIVIWTNIETKSKFISGKYVYLCIIPTVNISLSLPLYSMHAMISSQMN